MRPTLAVLAMLVLPSFAAADAHPLESYDDVRAACEGVRETRSARLFVVQIEDGWRFGNHDTREGRLSVDTRRNFRALDGHVSLLLTGLESPEFDADTAQAATLRQAQEGGAELHIGFFLGLDDPRRQPCVLRSQHGVTIVRAELAFAELRGADDQRVARVDSDRLRAWSDALEASAIPGDGPRGAVGAARFTDGRAVPDGWQAALTAPGVRTGFVPCHTAGIERGASREGSVVVRLNIETRTGRIRRADVALSSLGNEEDASCIARALGSGVTLAPGPTTWQAQVVDVSVPVRLTVD